MVLVTPHALRLTPFKTLITALSTAQNWNLEIKWESGILAVQFQILVILFLCNQEQLL